MKKIQSGSHPTFSDEEAIRLTSFTASTATAEAAARWELSQGSVRRNTNKHPSRKRPPGKDRDYRLRKKQKEMEQQQSLTTQRDQCKTIALDWRAHCKLLESREKELISICRELIGVAYGALHTNIYEEEDEAASAIVVLRNHNDTINNMDFGERFVEPIDYQLKKAIQQENEKEEKEG